MAVLSSSTHQERVPGRLSSHKHHVVDVADVARSGGRDIIDIRRDTEELSLLDDIRRGLRPEHGGEKRLPTLLLYDEAGLKLFEEITYLDEYYLTNTEIKLLQDQAASIAQHVAPGSIIVELGSGNLRKVDILLRAIDNLGKEVEYYALDLSLRELQRTLSAVPKGSFNHVQCFGLHGTYDDGLEWLKKPMMRQKQKMILSLGSSIGNFSRTDAADFLKTFSAALGPSDSFLIAIDGCKDPDIVYHAYNDKHDITHRFVGNGLVHANRIIGKTVFDPAIWRVIGEYNIEAGRHQVFVSPCEDTTVDGVFVHKDEKVRIEESYKYSDVEVQALWHAAGLIEIDQWTNESGPRYAMHMISKRNYVFASAPEQYAPGPCPTMEEFTQLWQIWDTVTREMIPNEELLEKPIKLRNACIFYLGHIPTFFDMKIADVTDGTHTDPAYYPEIFERGIDPDVDNPSQCHSHSEIPDDWPQLDEILAFQERVRQRIKALYDSGMAHEPKIARALWLGYEHEAMHLETLLYMLIQSDKTMSPPGVSKPDFEALAKEAKQLAVPNAWIKVPASHIELGLDDPETTSGPSRYFGWDVEKPVRKVNVAAFEAKARPITIGEYAIYLEQTGKSLLPASWIITSTSPHINGLSTGIVGNGYPTSNGQTNGHAKGTQNSANSEDAPSSYFLKGKAVRTVHGAIALQYCLDWPASASYDELIGCANWMGGRIPTLEEVRSIYAYVDRQRKEAISTTQKTIPAVNGHLINNGVQESPPSPAPQSNGVGASKPDPNELFVELEFANVGFKCWNPTPVTSHGDALSGQAEFGGLWELTSSPLTKAEGFEPMPMYPAYSADFYDGKHNIVLGGSWATVSRIAGRKSFVNWYQRNYPYVWAGARLVRDL